MKANPRPESARCDLHLLHTQILSPSNKTRKWPGEIKESLARTTFPRVIDVDSEAKVLLLPTMMEATTLPSLPLASLRLATNVAGALSDVSFSSILSHVSCVLTTLQRSRSTTTVRGGERSEIDGETRKKTRLLVLWDCRL